MKRIVLFSVLFGFLSSGAFAQDDLYFTPKKVDKEEVVNHEDSPTVVYYSGSSRDVDEYNRRGQFADSFAYDSDSLQSDVISLDVDSVYIVDGGAAAEEDYSYDTDDDYAYSRMMSRFDGFYWYDPWYYDWYGPYGWYGRPYWYAGWWYDPWYDPWYYGWYRPWRWWYPSYYVSYHRPYHGVTGTMNHGRVYGHGATTTGQFRGSRSGGNRYNNNRRTYNRNNNGTNSTTNRFRGTRQDNFNNRRNNQNFNNRQNTQSRPSFNGSRSFGGSRSGGSFRSGGSSGGSRSGGSFRGRR